VLKDAKQTVQRPSQKYVSRFPIFTLVPRFQERFLTIVSFFELWYSNCSAISMFRLTAPYMFSLGVVQVAMTWFHHNSVFEPPTVDHINCPKYWWRNILYINTLFPVEDMVSIKKIN